MISYVFFDNGQNGKTERYFFYNDQGDLLREKEMMYKKEGEKWVPLSKEGTTKTYRYLYDQHDACEHVTEKTEGKREDLREFRDQFQQTNKEVHGAKERDLEHALGVEELTQIPKALRAETDHLDHHHRDQSQRHCEVQIH